MPILSQLVSGSKLETAKGSSRLAQSPSPWGLTSRLKKALKGAMGGGSVPTPDEFPCYIRTISVHPRANSNSHPR